MYNHLEKRLNVVESNLPKNDLLEKIDSLNDSELDYYLGKVRSKEANDHKDIIELVRAYKITIELYKKDPKLKDIIESMEKDIKDLPDFYETYLPYFRQAWKDKGKDFSVFPSYLETEREFQK